MSDLLSFNSVFDEVFLYPPLLEACSHLIGEPFKLSSFLARTVRPRTPAQELHVVRIRSHRGCLSGREWSDSLRPWVTQLARCSMRSTLSASGGIPWRDSCMW